MEKRTLRQIWNEVYRLDPNRRAELFPEIIEMWDCCDDIFKDTYILTHQQSDISLKFSAPRFEAEEDWLNYNISPSPRFIFTNLPPTSSHKILYKAWKMISGFENTDGFISRLRKGVCEYLFNILRVYGSKRRSLPFQVYISTNERRCFTSSLHFSSGGRHSFINTEFYFTLIVFYGPKL